MKEFIKKDGTVYIGRGDFIGAGDQQPAGDQKDPGGKYAARGGGRAVDRVGIVLVLTRLEPEVVKNDSGRRFLA